jgi:acyl carrier protein
MTNLKKYDQVFTETFEITENKLEDLKYLSIERWDSINHMGLIAALEDVFEVELDVDDIIDFSSYKKGKEILAKYDLEF